MFAYCGNNPVNRSDPSGHKWKFWRVLFEDHRPGYIHWAVEAHIVLDGVAQKELVLPGVGRADIYRPETGEIWEIKYGGSSEAAQQKNTNKALEQIVLYLNNKEIPLQIGAAGAFKGEFVLDCGGYSYLITYDTPQAGVILYYEKALGKRQGDAFGVYPSLEFAKKDDRKSYAWVLGFFMPSFGGDSVFNKQDLQESFG